MKAIAAQRVREAGKAKSEESQECRKSAERMKEEMRERGMSERKEQVVTRGDARWMTEEQFEAKWRCDAGFSSRPVAARRGSEVEERQGDEVCRGWHERGVRG